MKTQVQQRPALCLTSDEITSSLSAHCMRGFGFKALTFNPIIQPLLLYTAEPGLIFLPLTVNRLCICSITCHLSLSRFLSLSPPLSLSGREPSISSDTRTDSSTDSSSHRTSRSRPLHQSTGSHLSSESQTTVVCNYDIGTPPLGADAGGNATNAVIYYRGTHFYQLRHSLKYLQVREWLQGFLGVEV